MAHLGLSGGPLNPWERDEWDIALSTGMLLRVHFELATERWFLEGCYD